MEQEKLLEIRDLAVEYHTDEARIYAINHINLSIKKGETIGLVGETGAGKTSIARSILRILPMPPAQKSFPVKFFTTAMTFLSCRTGNAKNPRK